jgi:hypothetical protein
MALPTQFAQFTLSVATLRYEDAGNGVATRKTIPLARIDCVEASSIATEVYPSRGKVVVHAGSVRLEASVDGEGAGDAAAAFAEHVLLRIALR